MTLKFVDKHKRHEIIIKHNYCEKLNNLLAFFTDKEIVCIND